MRRFDFASMSVTRLLTAAIMLGLSGHASASNGQAASPECGTPPSSGWSEQETWAWQKILGGKDADFTTSEGATRCPNIRSRFLEDILFQKPYIEQLPRRGVRIVGAVFAERLDLSNSTITKILLIRNSRFDGVVDLSYSKALANIAFRDSAFAETVLLNGMSAAQRLDLRGNLFEKGVNAATARVGDLFLAGRSLFVGELNLSRASVASGADIKGAQFRHGFDFRGTTFDQVLDMREIVVDGKWSGIMERMTVRNSLVLRGARSESSISLHDAKIGGDLDLSGGVFSTVDLTGANVDGELRLTLGEKCTRWSGAGRLVLRNAAAFAVREDPSACGETEDAWPETGGLYLTGFSYRSLTGYDQAVEGSMAERPVDWLKNWLARQHRYSPQPYQRLADVLMQHGYAAKARQIHYARKDRERKSATGLKEVNLTLQYIFIGYGYAYSAAIYWVIGLTLAGAIVLQLFSTSTGNSFLGSLFYSFDRLVPLVRLSESHFDPEIEGGAKYYFFVHRLVGFVLASYLVAGLAGIT